MEVYRGGPSSKVSQCRWSLTVALVREPVDHRCLFACRLFRVFAEMPCGSPTVPVGLVCGSCCHPLFPSRTSCVFQLAQNNTVDLNSPPLNITCTAGQWSPLPFVRGQQRLLDIFAPWILAVQDLSIFCVCIVLLQQLCTSILSMVLLFQHLMTDLPLSCWLCCHHSFLRQSSASSSDWRVSYQCCAQHHFAGFLQHQHLVPANGCDICPEGHLWELLARNHRTADLLLPLRYPEG
jgi:hypothetical protein